MKLPALTNGQRQTEEARALHEAIWTASRVGERFTIQTTPDEAEQAQQVVSGTLRGFWERRGYVFRTHQRTDGLGIELWVEPKVGRGEPSA